MGTLFDSLNAPFEAVTDAVHGETFNFTPMASVVNGRPVADGSRVAVIGLKAVWIDPAERLEIFAEGDRMATDNPQILLLDTVLSGVRRSDLFDRIKDGRRYEVTAVRPEGVARTKLDVKEKGLTP